MIVRMFSFKIIVKERAIFTIDARVVGSTIVGRKSLILVPSEVYLSDSWIGVTSVDG